MATNIFGGSALQQTQVATGKAEAYNPYRPGIMPVTDNYLTPDKLKKEWEQDTGGAQNSGIGLAVMTESRFIGGLQLGSSSAANSFDSWYQQKYGTGANVSESFGNPVGAKPSGYYFDSSTGRYQPIRTNQPSYTPPSQVRQQPQMTQEQKEVSTMTPEQIRQGAIRWALGSDATAQDVYDAKMRDYEERLRIGRENRARKVQEQLLAVPELASGQIDVADSIARYDLLSTFDSSIHADEKYVQDKAAMRANYESLQGKYSASRLKEFYNSWNKNAERQAVIRALTNEAKAYFSDDGEYEKEIDSQEIRARYNSAIGTLKNERSIKEKAEALALEENHDPEKSVIDKNIEMSNKLKQADRSYSGWALDFKKENNITEAEFQSIRKSVGYLSPTNPNPTEYREFLTTEQKDSLEAGGFPNFILSRDQMVQVHQYLAKSGNTAEDRRMLGLALGTGTIASVRKSALEYIETKLKKSGILTVKKTRAPIQKTKEQILLERAKSVREHRRNLKW